LLFFIRKLLLILYKFCYLSLAKVQDFFLPMLIDVYLFVFIDLRNKELKGYRTDASSKNNTAGITIRR